MRHMNLRITEPVSSSLTHAAALLGISPAKLANQLLQDGLSARLAADGSAFLAELAMMQRYETRNAAEAVCARLEQNAVSESLEGRCPFTITQKCSKARKVTESRLSSFILTARVGSLRFRARS
jgi:hypothetical protein